MESDPIRGGNRRRKSRLIVIDGCAIAVLLVAVVVVPAVAPSNPTKPFKATFIQKCEKLPAGNRRTNCETLWSAFEQAYVGRDPCQIPKENYDHLLSIEPPQPECNRMLFWSGLKEVAHQAAEGCYQTLEDTVLGSILDGETWCGEEGSNNTQTTGCPKCENSSVSSFWRTASAEFAASACGEVYVLLDGSRPTPFWPGSFFASIEIKKFTPKLMKRLTAVLVTKDPVVGTCENESLKNLRKALDPGIKYICKEVTESKLLSIKYPAGNCGAKL